MDYEERRKAMMSHLAQAGYVTDQRVLETMATVAREEFVPEEARPDAYLDMPLSIGYGQTISAPSIVGKMTELVEPSPDATVLEIGTGCGYQTAVLAKMFGHVYTMEIVADLASEAARRLRRLGLTNVTVKLGDGYRGWASRAPFDAILVTCAPKHVPAPLVEQLKDGGRMVIPVGGPWQQELYLLRKEGGRVVKRSVSAVMFVPMTGEAEGGS